MSFMTHKYRGYNNKDDGGKNIKCVIQHYQKEPWFEDQSIEPMDAYYYTVDVMKIVYLQGIKK